MNESLNRYAQLLGRVLLCAIFLSTGFSKITHWSATAGAMASAGIPVVPVSLALAILMELGGGLAILLGYWARPAALLMFFYLAVVTLSFHHFWTYQGAAQQTQMINFLKNLAILGGLLQLASQGAGGLSLDAKRLRV